MNGFDGAENPRGLANIVIEGSQSNWRSVPTIVLLISSANGDEVVIRSRTLITDWNVELAGKQFGDNTGMLMRINGRGRMKELIATPTKVIVQRALISILLMARPTLRTSPIFLSGGASANLYPSKTSCKRER